VRTPIDAYAECLDALRSGDSITPVERLRRSTAELLEWLPEGVDAEQAERGFPALHAQLEKCLAPAQPLLDFGGERGASAVCWMLQSLASVHGDSSNLLREPMLSLALHDLTWTVLADCLARDRLEVLPRLVSVTVPDPYGDVAPIPVLSTPDVRHTNAFDRGADKTYLSWRNWVLGSQLIKALPHLTVSTRLGDALAETELLAALCFAAQHNEGFCAALGNQTGERQFRTHLRLPGAVQVFAEILNVDLATLPDRANQLYGLLQGPDNRRPRVPLISVGPV
jgi:hypothetical protein